MKNTIIFFVNREKILKTSRFSLISQLQPSPQPRALKGKRIFRITIENESKIEKVASWRLTPVKCALLGVGGFLSMMFLAGCVIRLTPLRSFLPGYLKEKERSVTEERILRIDSISQALNTNAEFLANLRTVLDVDRVPSDSINAMQPINRLTSDSLLPTSKEEEQFIAKMQERERYNISVIAPLASEGMIFHPVSQESIFTEESKTSLDARIVLAEGAPVESVADGIVVAVYASERDGGGHTVVIQHGKGFLTAYSRLTLPMVSKGDKVDGGQTISIQQSGLGIKQQEVILRMWHNTTPLIPYDYIGPAVKPVRDSSGYEAPRGR